MVHVSKSLVLHPINFTELCEPGSYSENRFQPCKPCLKGFYQLNHGGTYCLPCTNTTVNTQCHSGE